MAKKTVSIPGLILPSPKKILPIGNFLIFANIHSPNLDTEEEAAARVEELLHTTTLSGYAELFFDRLEAEREKGSMRGPGYFERARSGIYIDANRAPTIAADHFMAACAWARYPDEVADDVRRVLFIADFEESGVPLLEFEPSWARGPSTGPR